MIVADLASSGVDVSRHTVVRTLHHGGHHGHRFSQTEFCSVLWSDDTRLELFGHMDVVHVWQRERERSSTLTTQFPQLNMGLRAVGLFCSLMHREPCLGAWHHEKRIS